MPKNSTAKHSGLSINENRAASKYSRKALMGRVLWGLTWGLLFRPSPRLCYTWRAFLLRSFGAKIGKNVHIYPNVKITQPWELSIDSYSAVGDGVILYNLGPMVIEKEVTISQRAHLCGGTHDFRDRKMPLIKETVRICRGAWICTEAFVGPGITIGEEAVVGARAVVVKDVPKRTIVGGNPAKPLGERTFIDELNAPKKDSK
ncbi:MAG: putative colanic acid biosynthesis acetyltransferase [Sumerlaeia bacterium]